MSRVLVTGGGGFIGRHALPLLTDAGHEVHAVSSREAAGRGAVIWHQCDLLAPGGGTRLLEEVRPTHLLHLAWYTTPGEFWTSVENFSWVAATLNLLDAFRKSGGRRFVAAGTCAEYEWGRGACVESATPLNPSTPYGTCKHALQLLLASYGRVTGISTAWGRVFHLYGPGERAGRLVPEVVGKLLSGLPAACTDGSQVRDFMHVRDTASAFVALLESDLPGPVNIASGQRVTVRQVVSEIAEQLGRADLLQLGARPTPETEPAELLADIGLLRGLGWRPRYDLHAGIAQTIEWWRAQADGAPVPAPSTTGGIS